MAVLYSNNAASALSASITNTATSFSVASGKGALFPAVTGADYFYVTLVDTGGNYEVVKVTARSVDTFTVVRSQDGTTGLAFSAGDKVELRIVKALLDDFKTDTRAGYLPLSGGDMSGRIRMGSFANSQTNSGEAWLGRASDRSAGSMTVQLGTGNDRFFEVVDYGWTTVAFKVGMSDFSYKGSAVLHAGNYGGYSTFSGLVTASQSGFQSATYSSGRNRIWSFGNADAYGLSYFQGAGGYTSGVDMIGLHFGTASVASSQFSFVQDGRFYSTGQHYAAGNLVLHAGNYGGYSTFSGQVTGTTLRETASSSSAANFGTVASTWAGGNYPTLYSDDPARWVMHINPHISYVASGSNGYTGSMTGATVRFASNPAAATYWDIGVGTNSVGADNFSIGRAGTSFLRFNNAGVMTSVAAGYSSALSGTAWAAPFQSGETNVGASGTVYIPLISQTSLSNSGYRQHTVFGSVRGQTWGSAFIAVGGNDSYPTVAFTFDYGGSFWAPSAVGGDRHYAGYDAGVSGAMSVNNWFRTSGANGMYYASYGRGIRSPDGVVSYGNNVIYGSGLNGWQGWSVNDSNNCILMSSGSWGFYNPAGGVWMMNSDFSGNVTFNGNVTAYSDLRLKENVRPVDNVIERRDTLAMAAIKYERDGRTRVGYGAQTLLENGCHEFVIEADDALKTATGLGTLSVDYGETAAVLAVTSKMTDDRVALLEARIAQLENTSWTKKVANACRSFITRR